MRPLRIGAERATHCDAVGGLSSRYFVAVIVSGATPCSTQRSSAPFAEHVWAGFALAVIEAWREEQAIEVRARVPPRWLATVFGSLNALVIVDRLGRRHDRIGEPVVLDELVTDGPEGGKVRVHGVDSRRTIRRQIPPGSRIRKKNAFLHRPSRKLANETDDRAERTGREALQCGAGRGAGSSVKSELSDKSVCYIGSWRRSPPRISRNSLKSHINCLRRVSSP
jgi:hypothetical protein